MHCVRWRYGLLLMAVITPLMAKEPAPDAYLVKEGQARARILLPRECGKEIVFAAAELSGYIEKMTGVKVPIDYGDPADRANPLEITRILLESDPAGLDDTFTLAAKPGRGQLSPTLTIKGNSNIAVLYGVYQYLNDLGVRWFMPGDLGENVPRMDEIKLAYGTRTCTPSFRSRQIDYSGYQSTHFHPDHEAEQHHEYDLWLMRQRCQFTRSLHWASHLHRFDFNWRREEPSHNIRQMALKGADFKQEPERFPLVTQDGKAERRERSGQICLTHPKNLATAVQSVMEFFAKNAQHITCPLHMADEAGFCECANCTRANGGVSPRVDPNRVTWLFMKEVGAQLAGKMPGKHVSFYSNYIWMTQPPEDIRDVQGVVAMTCHIVNNARDITNPDDPWNQRYYASMKRAKATGAEMACYDYSTYGGSPQPLTVLSAIKTYSAEGYVWYHFENMQRDEQHKISDWVLAQLAWDATQDPAVLLKTFCEQYYGAAGEDVLKVLEAIEGRVRALKEIVLGGPLTTWLVMNDSLVSDGRKILGQAERKVKGREKERLERLAHTFEMYAGQALAIRAYYDALDQRTEAARSTMVRRIDEFTGYWDKNNLSLYCSPSIRSGIAALKGRLEKCDFSAPPPAQAAERLAKADRTVLLEELFSYRQVPAKVDNLFLLPEVWKFSLDIDRNGMEKGWSRPEFDDARWVNLSTYNFYEQQGYPYDGRFWYRVRFKAPEFPAGKKVALVIGSLDDDGDVYLNGRLVHRRLHLEPNDWQTSFEIDVTEALRPGEENVIAVHGNDESGAGGIWKPCALYTP